MAAASVFLFNSPATMNTTFLELAGRASTLVIYSPNSEGIPSTTPSLTANLVCRVMLAIIGNLVSLVPLRLLYRNGEFAVTVFIANLILLNLQITVNTLIWRNDDMESWWHGQGFCDFVPHLHNFNYGVYATSMVAIMRNLAQQVGLLRASPLTVQEKRRRNLGQALLIFPLPLLQVAMTWPLAEHRYMVGTFLGCTWLPSSTWPLVLFYIIPPVACALLSTFYAVLTFIRYRQATHSTQTALCSNRLAHVRAQRTRRRLYHMVLSILIPYLPMSIALFVLDLLELPGLLPFDIHAIHNPPLPDSWNTVLLASSRDIDSVAINQAWIPILTAIPIFVFFGMTKEALNDYRRVLVFFQLGKIFPGLNEEYDPDRAAYLSSSFGSSGVNSSSSKSRDKLRSFVSAKKFEGLFSSQSRGGSSVEVPLSSQPLDRVSSAGMGNNNFGSCDGTAAPAPQLENHSGVSAPTKLPPRNPFLFRTTLDFPFPAFRLPGFVSPTKKSKPSPSAPESSLPLHALSSPPAALLSVTPADKWRGLKEAEKVETKVWSQERHGIEAGDENDGPRRGVVIQTMLTRESHRANG